MGTLWEVNMKTKNVFKFLLCVLVGCFIFVLFLMGGSDYRTYPDQKADRWVCDDPHFVLDFTDDFSDTSIEWKGNKYYVDIGVHASYFDVFLRAEDRVLREENILLRGSWNYVKGSMVVEIHEDNLFGGAYTELVFEPQ